MADTPASFQELLVLTNKFIRAEEADRKKMEDTRKDDRNQGSGSRGRRDREGRRANSRTDRRDSRPERRTDRFTPLVKTPKEIYALMSGKGVFRNPLRMQTPGFKRNKDKYCDYHGDHGHDTNDYNDLKREIEFCVQSGQFGHLAVEARKYDYRRKDREAKGKGYAEEEKPRDKERRDRYDWNRKTDNKKQKVGK